MKKAKKAKKTSPILIKRPIEYFKELVQDALHNQKINTYESTEYYVVNLLSDYIYLEKMYPKIEDKLGGQPLAIILLNALQSQLATKIRLLKYLGDFSLFFSGFFSNNLIGKAIDIDYYQKIGTISYANLSVLMRTYGEKRGFYDLYKELATRFQLFVDVIAEVSDKSNLNSNKGLLRIYERWLKTGSQRDEMLLKSKGIIINSAIDSPFLQ